MNDELTWAQERCLNGIRLLTKHHGYAPSVRELREFLAYASNNAVCELLNILKVKEKITWQPNRARTIRIL